ncbi:outer membrane beta-barrel protein [Vibrio cionasavignyae]|uniref:outer membrane beta-barrel protein n=1 Tax=Vibrio cionasavignyae TaxID=2910252 RepID=UPI003D0FD552
MKKLTIIAFTLGLTSGSVFANDTSGWRLGGGIGEFTSSMSLDNSDELLKDSDAKTSYVLEAGYEFNDIIGLKLALQSGEWHNNVAQKNGEYTGKNIQEFKTLMITTDVGYTFELGNFDIKPYGELGGFATNGSSNLERHYPDRTETRNGIYQGHGIVYGLGTRITYNNNFYTDLNVLKTSSSMAREYGEWDQGIEEPVQARMTIGWKF